MYSLEAIRATFRFPDVLSNKLILSLFALVALYSIIRGIEFNNSKSLEPI